ncbi:hypothetical protein [Lysinibacillus sp. 38-6]|uniref:hypothetical protein n=1 Tax=Lysinibacillus sp. 38-6 TaxID=3385991 RepID=UPI003908A617
MKNIAKLLFASFLCLSISLSLITYVSASENVNPEKFISPYQEVMDKLTNEYGVEFYINPEKMDHFYNNVRDMSPEELEKILREQYKDFLGNFYNDMDSNSNYLISPLSINEDITQQVALRYNSSMYLNSKIFSATGNPGTYIYQSIKSYGTTWPSTYTGYHWQVDDASHKLSSDSKSCTVYLRGHPENAYGVSLALSLTASYTFYAN